MAGIDKNKIHATWVRKHEKEQPECPVCGKKIKTGDLPECEYVKSKRGTEMFVHTKCVKKWGK